MQYKCELFKFSLFSDIILVLICILVCIMEGNKFLSYSLTYFF